MDVWHLAGRPLLYIPRCFQQQFHLDKYMQRIELVTYQLRHTVAILGKDYLICMDFGTIQKCTKVWKNSLDLLDILVGAQVLLKQHFV